MTEKIDVKKIMIEIEKEVAKKMNNKEYVKDLTRLEKMSVKKRMEGNIFDMYSQIYLSKKLVIPRSTRKGYISKTVNVFLVKLYYVMTKMLDPVLHSQENFNRAVLNEITKIKKQIGVQTLEQFPYEEFQDRFRTSEQERIKEFMAYAKYIKGVPNALALGCDDGLILEFFEKQNTDKIMGVEEYATESLLAKKGYEIAKEETLDYLTDRSVNEFGVITLIDQIEFYSLGYLISVLRQVKRTLRPEHFVVIQTLDPSKVEAYTQSFNPRIKQLVHENLLRFLLEHFGFINIERIKLDDQSNKYAIAAQKP